jgi:hypothetical protein
VILLYKHIWQSIVQLQQRKAMTVICLGEMSGRLHGGVSDFQQAVHITTDKLVDNLVDNLLDSTFRVEYALFQRQEELIILVSIALAG